MNRNVEVKARLMNLAETQAKLKELADAPCQVLAQCDTFFQCQTGRLKLRVFGDGSGELICYQRPDTTQAKTSHYLISQAKDPADLHAVLASALGVVGEVRKTRLLYLIGQTRVHLDKVDGLGEFIELEVVLRPNQSEEQGREIAEKLARLLGIRNEEMVHCAYVDLHPEIAPESTRAAQASAVA